MTIATTLSFYSDPRDTTGRTLVRDDDLSDIKAAFGRAGCGRLASLAVLAGNTDDDQGYELDQASGPMT